MIKIVETDKIFKKTKKLGFWDEYNETIYIKKGLSDIQKAVVLTHESIHAANSFLNNEFISEDTIQAIAFLVVRNLIQEGFIDLPIRDIDKLANPSV